MECILGIQYMKTLRISLNNIPLENTAVITMGQFDKKKIALLAENEHVQLAIDQYSILILICT